MSSEYLYDSQPTPTAPAGWQPDPAGGTTVYGPVLRYWDGSAWTDRLKEPSFEDQTVLPRVGPNGATYGEWWQRGLGYFIDGIVLLPVYLIAVFWVINSLFSSSRFETLLTTDPSTPLTDAQVEGLVMNMQTDLLASLIPAMLTMTALVALYWIVMVAIWGRTVGGMAMGIKAVDRFGEVPGWGRSARRYGVILLCSLAGTITSFIPIIGGLLSSAASFLLLICFLSMLWNKDKQAWQDLAAGTYVIKTR